MLQAYWWSPRRSATAIASELRNHPRAWLELWHRTPRLANFGDEISSAILEELTGRRVAWAPIAKAEVVGVGSLLNVYVRLGGQGTIFGSGVRTPQTLGAIEDRLGPVLALRGKATRDVLGAPADTPLGDPGLVVRAILAVRRPSRSGAIVIPHFAVMGTAHGRAQLRRARAAGFEVVLPNEHPLDVARKIRTSNLVVTSSLHAVVFADALDVPVDLVTFGSAALDEPTFKYDDYMSVFGLTATITGIDEVLANVHSRARDEVRQARLARIRGQVDDIIEQLYSAAGPIR
jgi:pyruvyltransferase